MNKKYYTLFKPGYNDLNIRYTDNWGWEWVENAEWEKIPDKSLPFIEENIKKYGFKTPKSIYNEKDYKRALKKAEVLMNIKNDPLKTRELELLAIKIEEYENDIYPM